MITRKSTQFIPFSLIDSINIVAVSQPQVNYQRELISSVHIELDQSNRLSFAPSISRGNPKKWNSYKVRDYTDQKYSDQEGYNIRMFFGAEQFRANLDLFSQIYSSLPSRLAWVNIENPQNFVTKNHCAGPSSFSQGKNLPSKMLNVSQPPS